VTGIQAGHNAACLLNADPPIVLGWTGRLFRFGSASALAPLFKHRRMVFLLIAKGSLADDEEAEELARDALAFMAQYPQHRFEWLCNIEEESLKLRERGLSAHTHNGNIFIREDVYLPIAGLARNWDAIYNGRISLEKRNELAAEIGRVAFIAYRDPGEHTVEEFHAAWADLARIVPGGELLNRISKAGCKRLSPAEVNRAYAQADVGLCLSPREGSMRVAVEYQLAGLPIVGTPCRGGRDHYFDEETWMVVPPQALAVREAVKEMQARAISRDLVRSRVLKRLQSDRQGFIDFVQSIILEEGGSTTFAPQFDQLLHKNQFERWWSMRDFAARTWKAVEGR